MGSVIRSVGVARERSGRGRSIALEISAARRCLGGAGLGPDEVSLLVNAGIYRDDNIGEPAIASLIQRKLGANLDINGTPGTFSFDLSQGGCGFVTGMMLADELLRTTATPFGIVVAGDAEPTPGRSEGFTYDPAAAAVLLEAGEGRDGFLGFRVDAGSDRVDAHIGRLEWRGQEAGGHWLVVRSSGDYAEACVEAAAAAVAAFLDEAGLTPEDIDVVVPSQSPPRFVAGLRAATAMGDRVVDVTAEVGDVHTAGVGLAFERARRDGLLRPGAHVLFVAVGAGISTALALYRVPQSA